MNKDEIKFALECCKDTAIDSCYKCPYHTECRCNDELCKDVFSLINEQEKEIAQLKMNSKRDEYTIAKQEYDIEHLKRMRNQIAIDENDNFINFVRYPGERRFTRQGYKKFLTKQVENNLLNDFADWVIKQNLLNVKEALEQYREYRSMRLREAQV